MNVANWDLAENLMRRINLGDCLRRTTARYAKKEAVVYRERRVTYEEFNLHANRFGSALLGLGYGKGSKVAFLGLNCYEFLISLFGAAKSGMILVPLNPLLRPDELRYAIDHADVEAIVLEEGYAETIRDLISRLPKVRTLVKIDRGSGHEEEMLDFEELLSQGSPEELEVCIGDHDPVEILYTGGTTAFPRAAVLSHLSLVMSCVSTALDFKLDHHEVNLNVMPMFHVGQLCSTVSTILVGGRNVILPWVDFAAILESIQREKITLMVLLSPLWRALLYHPDFLKYDLSSLRFVLYFGAVMPESLLREVMDKVCPNLGLEFGQTEMSPTATTFKPEDQMRKLGSLGNSGTFVEIGVMDEEGNLLEPYQMGEFVYRSPHLMEGYYNDLESNAEAFKYGWFHSGDLGYLDEEGFVYFVDRKKDVIKTGGENVASIEVEKAIYLDKRVQEVHVIGLPHQKWGEAVTAVVVPRPGVEISEGDIIEHCKKHLAYYKVPKAVIFVEELPRSATGKALKYILRQQLREHYMDKEG